MKLCKLFLILAMNCSAWAAGPEVPDGWKMVWNDEFDRAGRLDPKKWSLCERGKSDWNDTMSDDRRVHEVKNGHLRLHGLVANPRKQPAEFITGGVVSKGKFEFHHGKIDIRARFKSAKGAWPALWMLGVKGGWPKNGEIDLMEHLNFDDVVHQTVHSDHTLTLDKTNTPPKTLTTRVKRDDFNTYGAEWDAEKIVFTVNGKPTLTYPRVPEKGAAQWPFNQPFYIIMSMQIGGNWVGAVDPMDYPAGMEVDWVRVYAPDKAR